MQAASQRHNGPLVVSQSVGGGLPGMVEDHGLTDSSSSHSTNAKNSTEYSVPSASLLDDLDEVRFGV